ncbi:Transmembrane channel-like protein 5 [Oopsacas minuta]|uniref:Transmembrane channel-like protein 5 n=1 Tax=Oopsacas minuta TaxID=111878 RepID=A0AAV7KJ10_9METZ|nr:Transmembrane channel-like protein 5 [Oopsacas minuta]
MATICSNAEITHTLLEHNIHSSTSNATEELGLELDRLNLVPRDVESNLDEGVESYNSVEEYVSQLLDDVLRKARQRPDITGVDIDIAIDSNKMNRYQELTDTKTSTPGDITVLPILGINRPQLARERRDLRTRHLQQDQKSYRVEFKKKWNVFQIVLTRVLSYMVLWRGAIKSLEEQLGSTVGTYFRFIRFLFLMSILPFLLTASFIFIPQMIYNYGYNLNDTLTRRSKFSLRGDLLGFISGYGWYGQTEFFYGAYHVDSEITEFHHNIPLAYLLTSFVVLLTYLVSMTIQYGYQFNQSVTPLLTSSDLHVSNMTFGAWDFGITKDVATSKHHDVIYRRFLSEIKRRKFIGDTWRGILKIVLVRIFFNSLTIFLLLLSAVIVLFTNIWAYSARCGFTVGLIGINIPGLINTVTVFVIIKVLQIIFIQFSALEYYQSKRTEVNVTLIRLILIRLASLFTVTTILFTTSNALDKNSKFPQNNTIFFGDETVNDWINSFGYYNTTIPDPDCNSEMCWEEYIGKEFYRLAVTYVAITLAVELLLNTSRHFINKHKISIHNTLGLGRSGKMVNTVYNLITVRPTFQVIKHILDLIYFQALIFLGFFFCPVLPLFAFLAYPLLFYLKLVACKYFKDPSLGTVSDDVTNNNLFYTYLLIATYLASMLGVLFALLRFQPSGNCGPFVEYAYFLQPISELAVSSSFVNTFCDVLTHPVFLYFIIYVLILVITALHFISRSYLKQSQVYKTILDIVIKKGNLFSQNRVDTWGKQDSKIKKTVKE